MSRREDLDNAIWSDPDFEALSANATLLYLWSFTNPRCGMAGMYKVSHRTMTESKVSLDAIGATLEELAEAGFAFYEDSVLWVRTRVKHLRSRSPQMAKAVVADLEKVTVRHPLRVKFHTEYKSDQWLGKYLPGPYDDPNGNLSKKPIGKGDSDRVSGPSPEGPGQGQGQGQGGSSTKQTTKGNVDQSEAPPSLPEVLLVRLPEVLTILRGVWDVRGGREPQERGVGLAMLRNPKADHVAVARQLEHWLLAGNGQHASTADIAKRFGDWCADAPASRPQAVISPVSELDRKRLESLKSLQSERGIA